MTLTDQEVHELNSPCGALQQVGLGTVVKAMQDDITTLQTQPPAWTQTKSVVDGQTLSTAAAVVLADGGTTGMTLKLPAAADSTGARFIIKNIGAGSTVIVDPYESETIDGAATKTSKSQWDVLDIVCDGVSWFMIGGVGASFDD
ncbi:MAG: hypothetical protein ACTSPB_01855 [Candidatus Thorarchaeota archaeon]